GEPTEWQAWTTQCQDCDPRPFCRGCETRYRNDHNFCPRCHYCTADGCCECERCGDCGDLVHDTDSCGCCDDHCGCSRHDDDDLPEAGRPWPAPRHSKFTCHRLVGVEWEFNDSAGDLRSWASKWRGGIHTDGSCGYEAVTPPLGGDHIASCLSD